MKLPRMLLTLAASISLVGGCGESTEPAWTAMPVPVPVPPPPPPPGDQVIYVARSDGLAATPLGRGSSPSWSPDGGRLAYISFRDGDAEIFVANADGSGETQLTRNTVSDHTPRWSPQGDRIAFARGGGGQLFVMNSDGTGETALTSAAIRAYPGAWSPDGRRLVFSFMQSFDDVGGFAVVNADGSGLTTLASRTKGAGSPAWAPDGNRIAFVADGTYVINADGSGLTKLAGGGEPVWSPDGSKIAVMRTPPPDPDSMWPVYGGSIWLLDANGGGATHLAETQTTGHLRWSPDGRQVLYNALGGGIQAVPIATGYPTFVVPRGVNVEASPDGTRIAFTCPGPC